MKWIKKRSIQPTLLIVSLLVILLSPESVIAGDKSIQKIDTREPVIVISIAAPISQPLVYRDDKNQPQGFLIEFLKLVEQKSNIRIHTSIMPWPRAMYEVEQGRKDAIMPTIYSKQRAELYVFPDKPLITFNTVFLKRANDDIQVTNIEAIGNKKVIAKIRSMTMGEAFDNAEKSGKINVIEVRDFDHAVLMLAHSRVDLVACVDFIAYSSLNRLDLFGSVDVLQFSHQPVPAYLAFSKRFAKQNNVNAIMAKIEEVKQSADYQDLVEKFLVEPQITNN